MSSPWSAGEPTREPPAKDTAHPESPAGSRKRKPRSTPVTPGVRDEAARPAESSNFSGTWKRKKSHAPNSAPGSPFGGVGPQARQTIIAFRTSTGRSFDRVIDANFSLSRARRAVLDKCSLAADTPITLSYSASDGSRIDLDDDEDLRAFQVHASREPTMTIHVVIPEGVAPAPAPAATPAPEPAAAPAAQAEGKKRRGRPSHKSADMDTAEPTEEAAAPEATPAADASAEASGTKPPKQRRKRKDSKAFAEAAAAQDTHVDSSSADASLIDSSLAHETQASAEPPAETPADAPAETAPEAPADGPSEAPAEDTSASPASPEKAKRHRRTKAEMEAFRAEKAAAKARKEQERAAAQENAADASGAGDETTIMHDARSEEHNAAAREAFDGVVARGDEAVQERLTELKAKKQRKNAVEREEQKMLVGYLGKDASKVGDAPKLSTSQTNADPAQSDEESRDQLSLPESHMSATNQVHGPAPPPRGPPTESTPRRSQPRFVDALERQERPDENEARPERPARSERAERPASDARRSASGPFKKLSELRPAALRRSFSRPEGEQRSEATAGPSSQQAGADDGASSSDDEDSESVSDSSEDEDAQRRGASRVSSLPLSKQAGASAATTAANESRAKRKRSFFSAFQ